MIHITRFLTWIFGISVSICSCVQPYDIEGELDGTSLLVVDGIITNQKEIYKVRLTYSSPTLNSYEDTEISGAQVSISDESDNQWSLWESEAGVYQTDSYEWQGEAGKTYTLHITTPDGKRYASLPETMQPVPDIDSIYFEVEGRPYLSSINIELTAWGLQIYVNTGTGDNQNGFYKWDWVETFEYQAPLVAEGQMSIPICYETHGAPRYLNISSTNGLGRDIVNRQPIHWVPKSGVRLTARYSLLVTQYSLTQQAFDYWENIREQIDNAGSLFDPPPTQIIGNVYNIDDDTELVLGYFQVSAVTKKRIFIRRGEVPSSPGGPVFAFGECSIEEPAAYCYDCTLYNASNTTVRPPFW